MNIIKYIFSIVGLAMLLGAFFLYTNTQNFLKTAITTNGTVTQLIRSNSRDSIVYRPVVEFKTKEGKLIEFTSSTGRNPPSYSRGEVIKILYSPSSPEKARIKGFFSLWGGASIVGGLGAVFFIIGFSILLSGIINTRKIKYLKKHGRPIKAKFQSVERNTSLKVNGRSPYQVYAQWRNPTTGELHVFHSENIWFNPNGHINREEITVLIGKDNPKKYHVDISFLPNIAS
ncbi:MAG: DUF3592 domain-containing protein [Thiotrichaceae bacterium]|nr:DUF3592 domain-containing protein [Thiotrichaceae bacterium]